MSLRLKILGEGYTFVPKKWELQKGRFQLKVFSSELQLSTGDTGCLGRKGAVHVKAGESIVQ